MFESAWKKNLYLAALLLLSLVLGIVASDVAYRMNRPDKVPVEPGQSHSE